MNRPLRIRSDEQGMGARGNACARVGRVSQALRRLRSEEQGVALVLALAIMLVLVLQPLRENGFIAALALVGWPEMVEFLSADVRRVTRWGSIGENLALRRGRVLTAREVVQEWLASRDGHCEALMDPKWRSAGVG